MSKDELLKLSSPDSRLCDILEYLNRPGEGSQHLLFRRLG